VSLGTERMSVWVEGAGGVIEVILSNIEEEEVGVVPLVYVPLGCVVPVAVDSVIKGMRVKVRSRFAFCISDCRGRTPFSWTGGLIILVLEG